jgi:hypothetical protein
MPRWYTVNKTQKQPQAHTGILNKETKDEDRRNRVSLFLTQVLNIIILKGKT